MRGATGITLQPHQIVRLPRKRNVMIDPSLVSNVIYNARSNRHHLPTSPNTAPATQNESHDWSTSHMTRHLQCAEQQASPSNLTKYCACHAKWPPNISKKLAENRWNVISNARPIREWSDHDPSMIRPRKRKPQPAAPQRLLFALVRSRFYWKFQCFPLRLSFQISPHAAPATKSDTWTSPNAAPATQNESHDWSASQMKPHLQCAEQQTSPSNLTKYCACHAKWISWLIHITYDTSFTMRGATGITFQPHQILRLPRKMTTQHLKEIGWKQVKRHFQCATDPRMIRPRSEHDPTQKTQTATRRATEATFRTRQEQILLKITTFPAPAIIPNFITCCACHEKWHMNFTKWVVFFFVVPCPIHWLNAYANASARLRGLERVPTPEVFNTRCLRGCLRGVLCWMAMLW